MFLVSSILRKTNLKIQNFAYWSRNFLEELKTKQNVLSKLTDLQANIFVIVWKKWEQGNLLLRFSNLYTALNICKKVKAAKSQKVFSIWSHLQKVYKITVWQVFIVVTVISLIPLKIRPNRNHFLKSSHLS